MIIHIVKANETIYSIASEYGISPQRLIADNGLYGLSSLIPGQSLIILKPDVTHVVKKGETIYSIARIYNITPSKLVRNNPSLILNTNLIEGEELTIVFDNQTDKAIKTYGFIYPFIPTDILAVQSTYSTSVAIFSYGFNTNGTLITINDEESIEILKQFDSIPIMVLSSITEDGIFEIEKTSVLFNNISVQSTLIDNMIYEMKEKGFKGVDIDFEFINPDDRDAFSEFVKNVTSRMNSEGFTVNVDLAPKTSSQQRGSLYEGHDYRALGMAANTVMLMTYEWGYTYSPPMAVAPINKVRAVVEYAISEIDNKKIYMGIPNYGYDWTLPYEKGISKAKVIGNEEAIRIAQRYSSTINFDNTAQTPYFTYTDSGIEHEVWFEDVRSIISKYNLIDEFSLLGSGYWNLMRPFMQNWSYVNSQYNIVKP